MKHLLVGAIFLLFSVSAVEAKLIAGFIRAHEGSVEIDRKGEMVNVPAGKSTRVMLVDTIPTYQAFKGEIFPFDGSRFELPARTTHIVTEDGFLGQRALGWHIMHGYLLRLTGSNLNGLVPRGAQAGAQWQANGVAVIHRSTGPMPPTTKGAMLNNHLLRTGNGCIAKIDGAGRGIAILRSNTDMRLVPGGFSLEQGGALIHLGLSQNSGLWTGRARIKGIDSFVEVASVAGRDTVRVLRGRLECNVFSTRKKFVVRGGQLLTIEKDGKAKLARFKSGGEARKIARDFISRMNKSGLSGFPGWSGKTEAPPPEPLPGPVVLRGPVARSEATQPTARKPQARAKANVLQRGPTIGKDKQGRSHLDPLRRTVPGSSPKDWTTAN